MLKTINCRDDSLATTGGMWNTMKQRKRCIVVAQGFYEWLKKGKEKVPHFVKRKDGQLMCMAGLWDCCHYENTDERLWSYTIITTDSNAQLSFLHDRMPVILENGSDEITTWLDPGRYEWTRELQSLLKPFRGELDCYPVSKEVGKVGNNSASFIVPVASAENKSNIANFFANANAKVKGEEKVTKDETEIEEAPIKEEGLETVNTERSEDNAPVPVPRSEPHGIKREHSDELEEPDRKALRLSEDTPKIKGEESKVALTSSPKKTRPAMRRSRNALSNGTSAPSKTEAKAKGTQKITNFFTK
jgi:putative SOS response-associated peptidase YedK